MAGLGPRDVDLLQTYDDYPVICVMQMEDLGFCEKGDVAPNLSKSNTFHLGRLVPAQHIRRSALGGSGRRCRRISRAWLRRSGS